MACSNEYFTYKEGSQSLIASSLQRPALEEPPAFLPLVTDFNSLFKHSLPTLPICFFCKGLFCVCVGVWGVHAEGRVGVPWCAHRERSEDNLQEMIIFLPFESWKLNSGLGGRHLYKLSDFPSPSTCFLMLGHLVYLLTTDMTTHQRLCMAPI